MEKKGAMASIIGVSTGHYYYVCSTKHNMAAPYLVVSSSGAHKTQTKPHSCRRDQSVGQSVSYQHMQATSFIKLVFELQQLGYHSMPCYVS
jgi:hypothetical protein